MQLTDKDGNIFGTGGLEITTSTGKPKVPVINTDITIGTTAIVGGVAGRLLYDNAGVVGETNGVHWDKVNSRMGFGTTTPAYGISHIGNIGVAAIFSQRDFGFGAYSQITQRASYIAYTTDGTTGLAIGAASGAARIQGFNGLPATSDKPIFLQSLGGNVGIGTTTDAGFRLDVNGTARITDNLFLANTKGLYFTTTALGILGNSGIGTISFLTNSISRLSIDNSGNINAINSPTAAFSNIFITGSNIEFRNGIHYFSWENNGNLFQIKNITNANTIPFAIFKATNNIGINTTTDAGFRLDVNGTARVVGSFIASAAIGAGSGSFALGTLATAASSTHGGALGYDAQSLNAHALAFGYSSRANGHSSVAIGRLAIANAADSVAFHNATSAGINSAAFGNGSTTTGTSSMATGSNAYTYLTGQLAVSGGSLNYKGDSQYSIYTSNLNTGIVNSGGTYSFAGIRPSNSTFGSDVTQIWYVECVVVFAVKGRTTAITEFALRDTYSIKYKLAVKSTYSLGTTILGTPVADSSFSDASMATTSVTFTIVSNNLVVNVTPPTWTSGGQMQFRGTASFGITELGVYGQPF